MQLWFTKEGNITEPLQPVDQPCIRMRLLVPNSLSQLEPVRLSIFHHLPDENCPSSLFYISTMYCRGDFWPHTWYILMIYLACKGHTSIFKISFFEVPFTWYFSFCDKCKKMKYKRITSSEIYFDITLWQTVYFNRFDVGTS